MGIPYGKQKVFLKDIKMDSIRNLKEMHGHSLRKSKGIPQRNQWGFLKEMKCNVLRKSMGIP